MSPAVSPGAAVPVLLTVAQAFELARFADRHGPPIVRPFDGGAVLVVLHAVGGLRPLTVLALDRAGRVLAQHKLPRAGEVTA